MVKEGMPLRPALRPTEIPHFVHHNCNLYIGKVGHGFKKEKGECRALRHEVVLTHSFSRSRGISKELVNLINGKSNIEAD